MMAAFRDKKILGLLLIAAMAIAALIQAGSDQDSANEDRLFFPGLKSSLALVTEVRVESLTGGSSVAIVKEDENWIVSEKSGYPAKFEVLSGLLNSLAELSIAERKTAKSENHQRLGLADEGDEAGVVVTLLVDAEVAHREDSEYTLMVGNDSRTHGTFVRRPGEDQVYLSEQSIDVTTEAIDYVDPVFLNLDSSQVKNVVITVSGSSLSANRDQVTGGMVIQNIPEGAELRYDTIGDSLARVFVNLRFDDVEPYSANKFTEVNSVTVVTLNEETLSVFSQIIDGEFWVHMNQGWQYKVSQYTYNELNKTMQDMLKADDDV